MFHWQPTDAGFAEFVEHCSNRATAAVPSLQRPDSLETALIVLQPHPDDAALSVGGVLANSSGKLTLISVFDQSEDATSTIRRHSEDLAFAKLLLADLRTCLLSESKSSSATRDPELVRSTLLSSLPKGTDRGLMLAPAAVGRHPDHRVLQAVAAELGCGIFWEDVAFWGIYASSIDDRILFSIRDHLRIEQFTLVALDISFHVEAKAVMLGLYSSQSTEVWRPLRYAWTAAREIGAPFHYCERLFVHDEHLPRVEQHWRGEVISGKPLRYGICDVKTGWLVQR
jgi:LmbE family N-acetylglucosaminyl deacetylase